MIPKPTPQILTRLMARVAAVVGLAITWLLLTPTAAFAGCTGATYESGGDSAAQCADSIPYTAAAVVGGTVALAVAAITIANLLRNALSTPATLAALAAHLPTTSASAQATTALAAAAAQQAEFGQPATDMVAEGAGTASAAAARANPGEAAESPDRATQTIDPVDVASGRVLMTQVDVALPGVLPLRIRRTHLSDYKYGRAFGRRWASTLDVHLEIDDRGVLLLREDGSTLVYPPPQAGQAVSPVAGDPWPLWPTESGFQVLDPVGGLTWQFDDRHPNPAMAPVGGSDRSRVIPLSAISRRTGDRIDLYTDEGGRTRELIHTGGYRIRVDWDESLDRVSALSLVNTDGTSRQLRGYGHDRNRRLTHITDGTGLPLRLAYDQAGRLTKWTDRNEHWYAYTYDAQGRCVSAAGTDGWLAVTLAHDDPNRTTIVTDALGHSTIYGWDDCHRVIRVTDPQGGNWASQRDERGRIVAQTDPLGRVTEYRYDVLGHLIGVLAPDRIGSSVEQTDDGLPTRLIDRDGAITAIVRDERGNATTIVDPAGATTRLGYDQRGHLAWTTDPTGAATTIACDPAGLPVRVEDPTGAVTTLARDSAGRVVRIMDAAGGTTLLTYDADDHLVSRTTPDGAVEAWAYDPEGNLTAHTSPVGAVTRFEYTPFDQLATRIDADGTRIRFDYDRQLQLTTVTNPIGLTWNYSHDPAGRLVAETDFDGRVLAYTHNAAGDPVTVTNGLGQTTTLVRDDLGRLIARDAPEGRTSYVYDPVGRLLRATSPTADLTLTRDVLGRVTAETVDGRTTSTTYDPAGRVVSRTAPSGLTSTWAHDARGQASSLTTAGHTLTFTHDVLGNLVDQSLITTTGVWQVLRHTHDPVGRLLTQTLYTGQTSESSHHLITHKGYAYRPDGYLAATADETGNQRNLTLDPVGRITHVTATGWLERYAYSPTGDIIQAQWPDPDPGQPDPAQGDREYTGTLIRRAGRIRYEHDSQGRVVLRQRTHHSAKPDTWRYAWNSEDRLVAVQTPDGTNWTYRYDPLGRRIGKYRHSTDGGVVERVDFTWDGPRLIETHHWTPDGRIQATTWDYRPNTFTPTTQTNRSWLNTAPQTEIDRRFHTIISDLVGTPTHLIDPDGNTAWHTQSTIWGTTVAANSGPVDCPLRFPGQYHDPETGHHYNNQRYYDPETGRCLTQDPLGLAAAPHPNAYVPNPTSQIDPLGLEGCPKVVVENQAGRFGDLDPGMPGDGLTPHHMPQDALHFLPRNDGGAIVMTHADHTLTRTYWSRGRITRATDAGLPFRTVLAKDILDLRQIGQQQYGDPTHFNSGIRSLLAYYRSIGQL